VEPSLAGPTRPQDRVPLREVKASVLTLLERELGADSAPAAMRVAERDLSYELHHGSVVIAAITSCTNTSNPAVMIGAGLLAKKAVQRGLRTRPWVKTSLAPGSKVVSDYLGEAGLTPYLEALGFHLVGYGCTTCIGNSGPLSEPIAEVIAAGQLHVAAVLSGNRNFDGRINPHTRLSYLASPPLVVAYALAGRLDINFETEPLGFDRGGKSVMLADIWPDPEEIATLVRGSIRREQFERRYSEVFEGDERWRGLDVPLGDLFAWDHGSTYVSRPPFLHDLPLAPTPLANIEAARVLALLGDSVTTDHISPAGAIARNSPAARYLESQGVAPREFNSYGSRRGNHEVMVRGTFANVRLRNLLVPGIEGGFTRFFPDGEEMTIYDAAVRYGREGAPLLVVAGADYGAGSSRDWAAKGTRLLGVKAVIAKSFERIHRSNLVGMGVLPLEFHAGEDATSLGLRGDESYDVTGFAEGLEPRQELQVLARRAQGGEVAFTVTARIDTPSEVGYFCHGGVLGYVLRRLLDDGAAASGRQPGQT